MFSLFSKIPYMLAVNLVLCTFSIITNTFYVLFPLKYNNIEKHISLVNFHKVNTCMKPVPKTRNRKNVTSTPDGRFRPHSKHFPQPPTRITNLLTSDTTD